MNPMIRLGFCVAISLWGSSALAIERYNSTTLACENVRQILRDQGLPFYAIPRSGCRAWRFTIATFATPIPVRQASMPNAPQYRHATTLPARC